MSLLITSSSQGANETNQIGIAVPYQFRNNLKNPLLIEPLSEIAVESVKINRMPQIDFEGSMVLNLWFGERLAEGGLDDSLSYFIPCQNTINQGSSPLDFAEKFKKILQENYSQHPEINSREIKVEIITDSVMGFVGYEFKIPGVGVAPTSLIPPADTRTQIDDNVGDDNSLVEWDGTTFLANGDDVCAQLMPINNQGGPLSLMNGSLTYSNLTYSIGQTVGVSRPIGLVNNAGMLESQDHESLFGADPSITGARVGPGDVTMMDYCAEVTTGGALLLFHSVAKTNPSGPGTDTSVQMEEIVYYQKAAGAYNQDNSTNSCFATGTPQLASKVSTVTFQGDGESMIILINGSVAAKAVTVNGSTKSQIPKPIGQSSWKMYPTVHFWDDEDEVNITKYACRTSSTIYNNQPENSWVSRCTIPTILGNGSGLDQYEELDAGVVPTPPWNNALRWPKVVDTRGPFQILNADADTSAKTLRTRKLTSASLITDYENIFIMGPIERYMPRLIQGWQPNTMEVLGFSPLAINASSNMVSTFGASFRSATRPSMLSQHSTFIRVPTLSHETYNFGTGNPSKILFQVPRFDNAGTETGALFFQNPDKTYVDLKNTTELRITDLDVQFVRKNETFARDLTGSSEVVFHVRKKSTR